MSKFEAVLLNYGKYVFIAVFNKAQKRRKI